MCSSDLMVQLLVLMKVIPYNWVNGGASDSYEAQAIQSIFSLMILSIIFVYVAADSKPQTNPMRQKILYAITLFWIVGLVMQLLGTTFERYFLSPVLLLAVVAHGLLVQSLKLQNR